MTKNVAALLNEYAEFRELIRVTQSLPDGDPDPAISMLRQGFAELYDALRESKNTEADWRAAAKALLCPSDLEALGIV